MMGGDNSEDGKLRCLAVCGFTLLGICIGKRAGPKFGSHGVLVDGRRLSEQ